MECHDVKKRLPELLDKDEMPEDATQLLDHLESCALCTNEMKRLQASWDLLETWKGIEPSSNFKQKVWTKIHERKTHEVSSRWFPRRWWISWVSWASLGSLAVVMLLIVTWILWPSSGKWSTDEMNKKRSALEMLVSLDVLEMEDLLTDMELLENLDMLLALEEVSQTLDKDG